MKLIKINDDLFIAVDDSKIQKGDYYVNVNDNFIAQCQSNDHAEKLNFTGRNKKITHSTYSLEEIEGVPIFNKVKPIELP
jgi:hypothetical protein